MTRKVGRMDMKRGQGAREALEDDQYSSKMSRQVKARGWSWKTNREKEQGKKDDEVVFSICIAWCKCRTCSIFAVFWACSSGCDLILSPTAPSFKWSCLRTPRETQRSGATRFFQGAPCSRGRWVHRQKLWGISCTLCQFLWWLPSSQRHKCLFSRRT